MVAAIHITDAYTAKAIFNSGEYLSEQILGDRCINLLDPAMATSHSMITQGSGCIINFEWTSTALASGSQAVEQCRFDELYMEHATSTMLSKAWRWRVRAPYDGNDLIMTAITFAPAVLKQTLLDQASHKSSPLVSKLYKCLNLRSKAEKEADRIINCLNEINSELARTKGKVIRVKVGK